MRCHYEVLEVPQTADDSQIKTAYRKLALRWHPDKNLDDADNAKTEFQFVQQAYEVLSDRQERAWYDQHREQILRGSNKDFQDNSLDVYQYFTTTCFKGYGDDDGGFYAVYRDIFETISKEDIEFFDDKEDFCEIPTFGTSSSNYNDVVGPFYAYWLGYSTRKSFVWLDPHSIQDFPDKRYFKIMEKENKKVRVKAKQERNEEVRALVAFVRKRDRRVREHAKVEEARILENRRKQEELSQARRLKRRKELSEKPEAEWSKFDNVKGQLKEIEKELAKEFGEKLSEDEDDSESELLDNSYCAACNKIFKTSKAFQNHEISKKHKENVEKLREYMEEEDEIAEEENEDNSTEENVEVDDLISEDLTEEEEEVEEVKTKKNKRKSKKVMQMKFSVSDHEDVNPVEVKAEEAGEQQESTEETVLTKKQKRRNKKGKSIPNGSSAHGENLEKVETNGEVVEKPKPNKKSKKGAKDLDDIDVAHCCVTCQANFPSKNKLFDHLKKNGHGVLLPQNQKSTKNKKKSKSNSVES